MNYLKYGTIDLTEDEKSHIIFQLKSFSEDVQGLEDLNLLYDKVIVQFKSKEEFSRSLINKYDPILCWYDAEKMQCIIYSLLYNPEDRDDSFSTICEFFEQYDIDVFQYLIKSP